MSVDQPQNRKTKHKRSGMLLRSTESRASLSALMVQHAFYSTSSNFVRKFAYSIARYVVAHL